MTPRSILAQGRRRHLILLLDTCVIRRVTGTSIDPDTDQITDTLTEIYAGKCRAKPFHTAHTGAVGEAPLELQRYDLQLPWDAAGPVLKDDVAVITASDDPWVTEWTTGRPLTVIDPEFNGLSTVRHLLVEDRG